MENAIDQLNNQLSEIIKNARKQQKLTLEGIAEKMDMTRQNYQLRMERFPIKMRIEQFYKLCKILGLHFDLSYLKGRGTSHIIYFKFPNSDVIIEATVMDIIIIDETTRYLVFDIENKKTLLIDPDWITFFEELPVD